MALKLTVIIDVEDLKNDANGRRRLNNLLAEANSDIHHFITHGGESNELLENRNRGIQNYDLSINIEEK